MHDTVQIPCDPLRWPPYFNPEPGTIACLEALPLIGSAWRTKRFLIAQVSARPWSCLNLWGSDPSVLRTLYVASCCVYTNYAWPSTCFIPDDPCDIIMWDPGPNLTFVVWWREIVAKFGLANDSYWDVSGRSYGEFIQWLSKASLR